MRKTELFNEINAINSYKDKEESEIIRDLLDMDITEIMSQITYAKHAVYLDFISDFYEINFESGEGFKLSEIMILTSLDEELADFFETDVYDFKIWRCKFFTEILKDAKSSYPAVNKLLNMQMAKFTETLKKLVSKAFWPDMFGDIVEAKKIYTSEIKYEFDENPTIGNLIQKGTLFFYDCAYYGHAMKFADVVDLLFISPLIIAFTKAKGKTKNEVIQNIIDTKNGGDNQTL